MLPSNAKRLITPLQFVFWGGLLCVVDFRISESVYPFFWVGSLLLLAGVYRLADLSAGEPYRRLMQIVRLVAVVSVFHGFFACIPLLRPTFVVIVQAAMVVVAAGATVGFCVAMRWLCEAARLTRSAGSWHTTTWLWTRIGLVPIWILSALATWAEVTEKPLAAGFRWLGVLLAIAMLFPLIHLLVSLSRMTGEARELAAAGVDVTPPVDDSPPHGPVQFTLRTLLMITVAVAILGGFLARPTLFYWQLSMVGLVLLGVVTFALEMRKAAWVMWIGAALLMMVGSAAITGYRSGGSHGIGYSTTEEYDKHIGPLGPWLLEQGFTLGDLPEPETMQGMVYSATPDHFERTCYVQESPGSGRLLVVIEEDPANQFARVLVTAQWKGFSWNVSPLAENERRFREILNERIQPR